MKAVITYLNDDEDHVVNFGEYTRIRFDFGDPNMKFIEISVGSTLDGKPCLDLRSGWNALVIEPQVTNSIKVRMSS